MYKNELKDLLLTLDALPDLRDKRKEIKALIKTQYENIGMCNIRIKQLIHDLIMGNILNVPLDNFGKVTQYARRKNFYFQRPKNTNDHLKHSYKK